jgi:hypothetical protein
VPLKPVGLLGTDASFDNTREYLADLAVLLARLGEVEIALHRLMEEQRKAQKRVNALKYNIIPPLPPDHPLHSVGARRGRTQHPLSGQGPARAAGNGRWLLNPAAPAPEAGASRPAWVDKRQDRRPVSRRRTLVRRRSMRWSPPSS